MIPPFLAVAYAALAEMTQQELDALYRDMLFDTDFIRRLIEVLR